MKHFYLLLLDSALALCFYVTQVIYLFSFPFTTNTDKLLQLIICVFIVGAIQIMCVFDGIRFLPSWVDKMLYIISCLLQKPILLPVIFSSAFFESKVASKRFSGRQHYTVDGIAPTQFVLAV